MDLTTIKPASGAIKKSKRIGRGQGSGKGGTSTKGHKGAQSRSGYSAKAGFEGGQMPIQRRVPKYGFNNPNKVTFKVINLDTLNELSEAYSSTTINMEFLVSHGMVSKKDIVKVLGRGEVKGAFKVSVHAFSQSAIKAIEKAGGSVEVIA